VRKSAFISIALRAWELWSVPFLWTSSVYASSRIERCFRDVHVVSHHISIATVSFEMVGQYMLGGPLAQRR